MNRIAKAINSIAKKFGYRILKIEQPHWTKEFIGITKFEKSVLNVCANYSMTSYESMYFFNKSHKAYKK
tara:strand:- start:319 stop:525 length:207 start_codon:yes stop_codon:yes gene_type:complete